MQGLMENIYYKSDKYSFCIYSIYMSPIQGSLSICLYPGFHPGLSPFAPLGQFRVIFIYRIKAKGLSQPSLGQRPRYRSTNIRALKERDIYPFDSLNCFCLLLRQLNTGN
jgi:hypothetical protein